MTLTLIQSHSDVRKQNFLHHLCLKVLNRFDLLLEFDLLLRRFGLLSRVLILSHLLSIQGREPNLCDFINKIFNIGLQSVTDQFLANVVW